MKKVVSLAVLLLVCLAATAPAATFRVNPEGSSGYATMTAAYTAAANGDTIVVAPGTYNEIVTTSKRLTWIGAGFDRTLSYCFQLMDGSAHTLIEGFRCDYTYPIFMYGTADSITIRRCMLVNTSSSYGCITRYQPTTSWLTVENCVLLGTYYGYGLQLAGDSCVVRNCVFSGNNYYTEYNAIYGNPRFLTVTNSVFLNATTLLGLTGNFGMMFANNTFSDWASTPAWGTYPATAVWDYNAAEAIAAPGTNGVVIASNPFPGYDPSGNYVIGTTDLHLGAGSNLIDTGMPSIHDRDSSRSDFGVYGGPYQFVSGGAPDYPMVISLVVPPAIIGGDSLNINSVGRIGPWY